MGIISNFFQKIRPKVVAFFGGRTYGAPYLKDAYEQETVRAIIDCIATHAAKAEAMHVILDDRGRIREIKRNSAYAKALNMRPNPIMTGYDLKYRLVANLEDKTTAMAYIRWKKVGASVVPDVIIPIDYSSFDFYQITGGGYAVQFIDALDGNIYTLNLEDVVVLRKFFNRNAVSGDGNMPIYNTLSMIKASDEGIMEALSVSNKVRGLLRQKKSMLATEDVEQSTKEFTDRFNNAAKNGGIVGVDSMEEFTPLTVTPWATNSAQMKEIRSNLFYFWRINDAILTSNYNEAQWQAFYEAVIEPILINMGQAFTNACFTQREQDVGNRIIFSSSMMINAAPATKVNLISQTKEIGLMTLNEQRELFGLAPVEDGDERYISLNYVKSSNMTEYQLGKQDDTGGDGAAGDGSSGDGSEGDGTDSGGDGSAAGDSNNGQSGDSGEGSTAQ